MDILAAALVGAILLLGSVTTWQSYQQWTALGDMDHHMGTSVTTLHGTHPLWYLVGTLLAAGIIAGIYVVSRERLLSIGTDRRRDATQGHVTESAASQALEAVANDDDTAQRILDLLPEDERRILQPILESPGLTQIALRDRSNFSKSKVSQTVTDLEKRGLIYREPQGRTFRIYPSDELEATDTSPDNTDGENRSE